MNFCSSRILVVEDDVALAEWIKDYLETHGFITKVVQRGDYVADAIRTCEPDLILLDIMLPYKNGFDVCRDIRKFYRCPILMMTACSEEADELLSLRLGADDYLSKPVRPKVLVARIEALLRRANPGGKKAELTFGALTVEYRSKAVLLHGEVLPVSGNEFEVLWLLASNPGQVISRAELVSQLRGIDYDGFDRSIDIRVSRLRKKLGDDPANPDKIKTIWGKGYLFTGESW